MSDIEVIRRELRMLNINSMPVVVAMSIQDALPEEWRVLVYKYGQARVFKLIVTGYTIQDAIQILAR